ncbi:MAG: tetratricopeptide repeat protein, partial [Caldilineaceae bacterium]|nr:tetratricopeptide repeat protein [Caldilineaceae bacterium]
MPTLQIYMFGALDVQLDEQPILSFRSIKNAALLAYLALEGDRPHARSALAALLWPEVPDSAALHNLRQALFQLRTLLRTPDRGADSFLEVATRTVQFRGSGNSWVDAAAFETLMQRCRQHGHAELTQCAPCMARHAEAVALYRGEFLKGLYVEDSPALDEWILLRREWYQHTALDAMSALARWHGSRGEFDLALQMAQRQLAIDSLREDAYRQAMWALAQSGHRNEALAAYETCWRVLYDELGVTPGHETETLREQIEEERVASVNADAAAAVAGRPAHNLPATTTSFVGRTNELTSLRHALLNPSNRLVSIVGPGGAGKTRLALAAAAELVGFFSDGVWFSDLIGVEKETGLAAALVRTLGISLPEHADPASRVVDFLRGRELLLILDNFEHLLEYAGYVQTLLAQAAGVKVLVTTRERLHLQAESVFVLDGLPVPESTEENFATLRRYSCVQLFVERAQRSALAFAFADDTLSHVAEICRLVGGLPLGIELAASWVEEYSCQEIAQAIARSIDFLQTSMRDLPVRHRSMRGVFDYSWHLLAPDEQRTLAQLSVMRGMFGREAALAVTGATVAELTALVHKSLLQVAAPGRYALHTLVRQFAASYLPDEAEVRRRHYTYYLTLVTTHARELVGATPGAAIDAIRRELDNVRVAWQWAVQQGDFQYLTEALPGLVRFFELAALYREAGDAVEEASVQARGMNAPALLAQLLAEQAKIQSTLGNYDPALTAAQEATEVARAHGLSHIEVMARMWCGNTLYAQGKVAEGRLELESALAQAETIGDIALLAACCQCLGDLLMYAANADADPLLERALALYRELGDRRGEAWTLNSLGVAASLRGQYEQGTEQFEAALRLSRGLGDEHRTSRILNNLAAVYAMRKDFAQSDRYFLQLLRQARETGYRVGEVIVLNNLGTNQLDQNNRPQARAYFERGLVLAREIGFLRGLSSVLYNLGVMAADDGDLEKGAAMMEESIAATRRMEDQHYLHVRLGRLGETREAQGRHEEAHA